MEFSLNLIIPESFFSGAKRKLLSVCWWSSAILVFLPFQIADWFIIYRALQRVTFRPQTMLKRQITEIIIYCELINKQGHVIMFFFFVCFFGICRQWRLRLNCTSVQAAQGLCFLLTVSFELQCQKTYLWTCEPSEDSDQLVHSCSLIKIFTGHSLDRQECTVS